MKCKLYLFYSDSLPREAQNYIFEGMTATKLLSFDRDSYMPYDMVDDFQVLRPTLELSIKINKSQVYAFREKANSEYTYCLIQWINSSDVVKSERFYFVSSIKQVAVDTIQLELKMDVLNSYKLDEVGDYNIHPYYMITSRSIIKRMHKDRIKNLHRTLLGYDFDITIDRYPEAINPILFKKEESYITGDNQTWYLVYMNANDPAGANDTQPKYINPVRMLVLSDRGYTLNIQTQSATTIRIDPQDNRIPKVNNCEEILIVSYPMCDTTHTITISGITYTLTQKGSATGYQMILLRRQNNNDQNFNAYAVKIKANGSIDGSPTDLGSVAYADFNGVQYCGLAVAFTFNASAFASAYTPYTLTQPFYIGSGAISTAVSKSGGAITSIDRTDAKLIKICCLPYTPFAELENTATFTSLPDIFVWNDTFSCLELSSTAIIEMKRTITMNNLVFQNQLHRTDYLNYLTTLTGRKEELETKLYNSEFSYIKFVYDSYTKIFKSELYDDTADYEGTATYVVSPNISSHFLVQFNDYQTIISEEDYDNIIIVDKDNELPLFTSAYLNYLRTGFQFDIDTKDRQNLNRGIGIALSAISAIASFASSGITHGFGVASGIAMTTSTISQVSSAVISAQQSDKNIQARMVQSANQSTSVSSQTDFSLMKEYTFNQFKTELWECSEIMKEAIYNLFYFCGYATNEYAPDTAEDLRLLTASRQLFNYIQADIELQNPSMFNEEIANEIIKKWSEGITFIHLRTEQVDPEETWVKPTRLKENIEVSQLPVNP